MDLNLKDDFIAKWNNYFPGAELPLAMIMKEHLKGEQKMPASKSWSCLICDLKKARNGKAIAFNEKAIGCGGGKRYSGFSGTMRPEFRYFLSCGIEGKVEGERYKKSPEIVDVLMEHMTQIPIGNNFLVFKPFNLLEEDDHPISITFFVKADVLSALFTLANFDTTTEEGVMVPFGAGCSTIIHYPYLENERVFARCVLGMFDISARPCVDKNELSFSIPLKRFRQLVCYMDESFLITDSWKKVKKRI